MRIDGSQLPEPRKCGDPTGPTGRSENPAAPPEAGQAEVVRSHQRLIAQAAAAPEVDAQAVAEARALLEAGELDSPEAAERAARAMLERGL